MTDGFRYKAFISYSHTDKVAGDKLLKDLENYRVPKRLVGKATPTGGIIPGRVGQVFRDRDELPAAEDLTAEVKKALTQSEFMIVLCSPAAAASRWVNREIIEFKKLTGERRILSVILSGEPFASDHGAADRECFPPALRFKLGDNGMLTTTPAEPLAADFRDGGDGPRRGRLKLVAGLLGVGLDTLIERDLQRKMRRVMAVTAASISAMLGMGFLTYEAVTARQDAERHRGEAEGLIEFMLTDLRDKLEPVGRLDVLDAVGVKAVDYYDRQALDDMPDDALGRRARAFHLLGEVSDGLGNRQDTQGKFLAAYNATKTLLAREPENTDRIFDHSQSAFWMGYIQRFEGNYDAALTSIEEYATLAQKLTSIEAKPDWKLEHAYAESSLGTLLLRQLHQPNRALKHFRIALDQFLELAANDPNKIARLKEAADLYAWVADAYMETEDFANALTYRSRQMDLIIDLQKVAPQDWDLHRFKSTSLLGKGRIERRNGEVAAAAESFKQSAALINELTLRDPENVRWLELSAVTHLFWADALITNDDNETADLKLNIARNIEEQLFSNGAPSEMQVWEIQVWREIIEMKFMKNIGLESKARQRAQGIGRRLTTLNKNGVTPWKGIRLKQELQLLLNSAISSKR